MWRSESAGGFSFATACYARAEGFTRFSSRKITLPPLLHLETLTDWGVSINFDSKTVRQSLDDEDRLIFDDDAPYGCLLLSLSGGSEHAFLIVKRREGGTARLNRLISTSAKIAYSEIMYCNNSRLLARHLERVKLAILRRQRRRGEGG